MSTPSPNLLNPAGPDNKTTFHSGKYQTNTRARANTTPHGNPKNTQDTNSSSRYHNSDNTQQRRRHRQSAYQHDQDHSELSTDKGYGSSSYNRRHYHHHRPPADSSQYYPTHHTAQYDTDYNHHYNHAPSDHHSSYKRRGSTRQRQTRESDYNGDTTATLSQLYQDQSTNDDDNNTHEILSTDDKMLPALPEQSTSPQKPSTIILQPLNCGRQYPGGPFQHRVPGKKSKQPLTLEFVNGRESTRSATPLCVVLKQSGDDTGMNGNTNTKVIVTTRGTKPQDHIVRDNNKRQRTAVRVERANCGINTLGDADDNMVCLSNLHQTTPQNTSQIFTTKKNQEDQPLEEPYKD